MDLPLPAPDQIYVSVSAIDGGSITMPETCCVHPADPDTKVAVPSLSFLIVHPTASGSQPIRLLFDLGLRTRLEDWTPAQQKHAENRKPFRLGPGISKQLAAQGIKANQISTVIFSHVHWDHTGDPNHFPTSRFIVGPGSRGILKNGLPGKGSHQSFDANLLPPERTSELPQIMEKAEWRNLGDFRAIDFFRDGSVFVLDAPGHLPGHLNLLCRTSPSTWICLAGDSYHDIRLRTGEREIGTWAAQDINGETQTHCLHLNRTAAEKHIEKLRSLAERGDVEIIAAHENIWLEENRHRLFPVRL